MAALGDRPVVSSLHVYPIKSCRGVDLDAMDFDGRGPRLDRHWMIVDEAGQFVTQREHERLAVAVPSFVGEGLRVEAQGAGALDLSSSVGSKRRIVRVWGFEGEAIDEGDVAAAWFSDLVRRAVRLVRFAPDAVRAVSRRHTDRESQTAFSDGYPVVLLSEASLAGLNARLEDPVPMNRFRPNVVVRGTPAHAEDDWKEIRIGTLGLDVVKPCDRCKITTVDQATGLAGKEPLATLSRYRRGERGVSFGQNCVHHGPGRIEVGMAVDVIR